MLRSILLALRLDHHVGNIFFHLCIAAIGLARLGRILIWKWGRLALKFKKFSPVIKAYCAVLRADIQLHSPLKKCFFVLFLQLPSEAFLQIDCLPPFKNHPAQKLGDVVLSRIPELLTLQCVISQRVESLAT